MSDQPATTSQVPATPPVTELAPNTVIHAPEPVVAPAVVVPPPAPEVPQDYRINTLENGQREVTLNTGQVYRGTAEEVINELAKAQFHASQRITELGRQIPPQQTTQEQVPQVDPTAKALADLTAQGMGFANADEYMAELNRVRGGYEQHQNAQVAQQFLAAVPDFPKSQENADRIDATMVALGLPNTLENLLVAHHYLKGTGQYVQVNAPPVAAPRAAGMPLPPTGNAAPATGTSEADIWAMPMAEVEKLYRQGR